MKKVVTVGGGTGQFTLLSGLKKYPLDLTAVVSMADNGGSTGRLRDELGVLPPGDVRQCLVALAEADEDLRRLMNYRFESGQLSGHNFGNLFLSALEKTTGSFGAAVEAATRLLNVRGRVLPVSEEQMHLRITLGDGTVLEGEKELDDNERLRHIGIENVELAEPVRLNPVVRETLRAADAVIIGPGDYFGSLLPNLLVDGFVSALSESSATTIFVAPLTTKLGHTHDWDVERHIRELERHLGAGAVDVVIVNETQPHPEIVQRYEQQEGKGSVVSSAFDGLSDKRVKRGDFLCSAAVCYDPADTISRTRSFIRHDGDKLAAAVAEILEI